MNTLRIGGICLQASPYFQKITGIPHPHFTKKEKTIWHALKERHGKVCTVHMLAEELYPGKLGRHLPGQKVVDVMISKIRKKLRTFGLPDPIQTIWGRGYRLGEPEQPVLSEHISAELQSINRWTPKTKEYVLSLITDLKSQRAILAYFTDLSAEELYEWRRLYQNGGSRALRTTCAWLNT